MRRQLFLVTVIIFFAALVQPALVSAHGGHELISDDAARARALDAVTLLVDRGKLVDSWLTATVASSEMVYVEGIEEWHVVIENLIETDLAKQKLYIFINFDGQLLAANFSGKSG